MHTMFGNFWNLLNPVLSIGVYYLVFGLLLGVTRGVEYFIPFLAIGVFVYQYTQRSTTQAARSLVANQGLLRSISFPRAMLPITTVLTETLAFIPGIVVFYTVAVLAGVPISPKWLLVLPLAVLQLFFNVGAAFVIARLNHSFRDIENLLPFLFRLLFYGSGVIFYVGAYLDDPGLRWVFIANPLFCFLALYRWAVLDMPAVWTEMASLGVWTIALVIGGLWWFRRAEASYGG
jgi:teichoic acid transport system permease protein